MRIMKLKATLSRPVQAQEKSSVMPGENKSQQTIQRATHKEHRGIYSATRNLDSNFRC